MHLFAVYEEDDLSNAWIGNESQTIASLSSSSPVLLRKEDSSLTKTLQWTWLDVYVARYLFFSSLCLDRLATDRIYLHQEEASSGICSINFVVIVNRRDYGGRSWSSARDSKFILSHLQAERCLERIVFMRDDWFCGAGRATHPMVSNGQSEQRKSYLRLEKSKSKLDFG